MIQTTIENAKKSCGKIKRVIRFVFWILFLFMVVRVFYTFLAVIMPANEITAILLKGNRWSVGPKEGIYFTNLIPADQFIGNEIKNPKIVYIIKGMIDNLYAGITLYIVWILLRLLNNISIEYSPFLIKNCQYLKYIGYSIIFMALIPRILQVTLLGVFSNGTFVYFTDLNFLIEIFVGCLILSLEKIFVYGCTLQTEQDETL